MHVYSNSSGSQVWQFWRQNKTTKWQGIRIQINFSTHFRDKQKNRGNIGALIYAIPSVEINNDHEVKRKEEIWWWNYYQEVQGYQNLEEKQQQQEEAQWYHHEKQPENNFSINWIPDI